MNTLTKGTAYARVLLRELVHEPSDLFEIAARLGLEVREVDADGFDGALIRAREIPLGAVVIRRSMPERGRKYFTVAHEIGHFLLPGHDQTELVCTRSDVGNWGDRSKETEREADEFAAELLMPSLPVQAIIRSAAPSLQLIEGIARRFQTSLSAAAWRYCDLTNERCAIVWSTRGQIQWSKCSDAFGYSLPKGTSIHTDTFASRCFARARVPRQAQATPASIWITSSDLSDSRIWEQSKALPAYDSVISLLCFR